MQALSCWNLPANEISSNLLNIISVHTDKEIQGMKMMKQHTLSIFNYIPSMPINIVIMIMSPGLLKYNFQWFNLPTKAYKMFPAYKYNAITSIQSTKINSLDFINSIQSTKILLNQANIQFDYTMSKHAWQTLSFSTLPTSLNCLNNHTNATQSWRILNMYKHWWITLR